MVTWPISFILGPAYQGETRYAAVRNSPLRLPVKRIFSRSLGDCDDRKLRLNPAPATIYYCIVSSNNLHSHSIPSDCLPQGAAFTRAFKYATVSGAVNYGNLSREGCRRPCLHLSSRPTASPGPPPTQTACTSLKPPGLCSSSSGTNRPAAISSAT